MIRRVSLTLIFSGLLFGCATPANHIPPTQAKLSLDNGALIVGRTLAIDTFARQTGLHIWLRNVDSGQYYTTSEGSSWGFPESQWFAFYVLPGKYALNAIFAYNGSLGPAPRALGFVAERGDVIYVGTLTQMINAPRRPPSASRVHATARYGRLRCPALGFGCDGKSENQSPNAKAEEPYASAVVLDEWPGVAEKVRQEFPKLPLEKLRPQLME